MFNNLIYFLDEVVQPDDLGKNWEIFEIFTIFIAILPWIFLILYIIFWRKYYISYYVNNKLVYKKAYKKDEAIDDYNYISENESVSDWFFDDEFIKKFNLFKMPKNNIKLYGKIENLDNEA